MEKYATKQGWTEIQTKQIVKHLQDELDGGMQSMIPSFLDVMKDMSSSQVQQLILSNRSWAEELHEHLAKEQPIEVPKLFEVKQEDLLNDLHLRKQDVMIKDVKCSKCHKSDELVSSGAVQQRSADEPMTQYYYCKRCDKQIRVG